MSVELVICILSDAASVDDTTTSASQLKCAG